MEIKMMIMMEIMMIAGGLDEMTFKGPFQPQPFCDSMTMMEMTMERLYLF